MIYQFYARKLKLTTKESFLVQNFIIFLCFRELKPLKQQTDYENAYFLQGISLTLTYLSRFKTPRQATLQTQTLSTSTTPSTLLRPPHASLPGPDPLL
jgi:hypothetical protein